MVVENVSLQLLREIEMLSETEGRYIQDLANMFISEDDQKIIIQMYVQELGKVYIISRKNKV